MPELHVAREDLADFYDGGRSAVFAEPPLCDALRAAQGENWRTFKIWAEADGALRFARQDHVEDWAPVAAFPGGGLVVVLGEGSPLDAFFARGDYARFEPPPVARVASAAAALAAVAGRLAEELRRAAMALTHTQSALVELRRDHETTQHAMAAALQTLGGRPVGAAQLFHAGGLAHGGLAKDSLRALGSGRSALRQKLGHPLRGLTAIGLHLAEVSCGEASWLRVRLVSADSGVTHGGWLVPGVALRPGWLTLDLRFVLGRIFETAVIELEAELGEGDRLALSLEPQICEDFVALDGGEGPSGRHALSLRLYRGEFGARTLIPRYWTWDDIGGADKSSADLWRHTPWRLSGDDWLKATVPEGEVEFVGVGAEAPRPVLALTLGRRAAVRLPGLLFPECHLVEIGVSLLRDPACVVRVHAALAPAGERGAGQWRTLVGTGDPSQFALTVPQGRGALDLTLCAELVEGQGPALLEWRSLAALRLPDGDIKNFRAIPAEIGGDLEPVEPPLAESRRSRPMTRPFAGVLVDHIFRGAEGDYAHIDLIVFDLAVTDGYCPAIRFKFISSASDASLEFRKLPDWPDVFDIWPGESADAYGPFFRLRADEGEIVRSLSRLSVQDARMLRALLAALPNITAVTLAEDVAASEPAAPWIRAAQRLSSACRDAAVELLSPKD